MIWRPRRKRFCWTRKPIFRSICANPYYGKVMEPLVTRWGLYRVLVRVYRPAGDLSFPHRQRHVSGAVGSRSILPGIAFRLQFLSARLHSAASGFGRLGYVLRRSCRSTTTTPRWPSRIVSFRTHQRIRTQESGRYNDWPALSGNPATLVAALNDELMFGTLSPEATQIIVYALTAINGSTDRVRTAVWLITNSPSSAR